MQLRIHASALERTWLSMAMEAVRSFHVHHTSIVPPDRLP
jgi:hypothetical protein